MVAGAGIGGLTAALALARRGRPTRVLEGATEFGAIGYGIQFGPNVFHVFDRLGLTEQVMAVADSPPAVLMLDALNGKELVRIPTGGAAFRARFKHPYIIVHRIEADHQPDAAVRGLQLNDGGDFIRLYPGYEIRQGFVRQPNRRNDVGIGDAAFGRERHTSLLHERDLLRRRSRHDIHELAAGTQIH